MIYMIAYTKDLATNQEISLNKNGNEYYVELRGYEIVRKHFKNKKDANERYLLIVQYFLDSWGSFEFRKNKLLGGINND